MRVSDVDPSPAPTVPEHAQTCHSVTDPWQGLAGMCAKSPISNSTGGDVYGAAVPNLQASGRVPRSPSSSWCHTSVPTVPVYVRHC
jgi:hypothetical protein